MRDLVTKATHVAPASVRPRALVIAPKYAWSDARSDIDTVVSLLEQAGLKLDERIPELGRALGSELLAPHRCYWPLLRPLIESRWVKGMAHITGGGLTENPPRILPRGCALEIRLGSWPVPPIFHLIERRGDVPRDDMLRTFNMGIGMILLVAESHLEEVGWRLSKSREKFWIIGRVTRGRPGVKYV